MTTKASIVTVNLVLLALLALASNRSVYSHLGHDAARRIDRMRSNSLVAEKSQAQLMTYYENLFFEGGDVKEALNKRYMGYRYPLADWDPFDGDGSPYWQPVDDLRGIAPRPSQVVTLDGVPHTFNRMGLRDREYSEAPDPGTFRIAMLGASNLMGRGIPDGRNFESVLERMLNRGELPGWEHYEIINFGYDAYTEVPELVLIDAGRVFSLEPSMLIFITHSVHDFWEPYFMRLAVRGEDEKIGYPFLERLAQRLRADERRYLRTSEREDVLRWVYGELVQRCETHGVPCLAVGVPLPDRLGDPELLRRRMALIRSTGMPVVSLDDSFDDYDIVELQRAGWDDLHLNEEGHRLIAGEIYASLVGLDDELGLGLGGG